MNNLTSKSICLFLLLCLAQMSQAQKLKDFIKKTTENIEEGISDAVSQVVADKIVEKAVSTMEGKIDTLLNNAFKIDSASRASQGDSINYFDFLQGMNESGKVPDEYIFHLGVESTITDDKGRVTESIQYFNKDGDYYGMLTEGTLMVFDSGNEILANFNLENKTGFAMGKSMMKSIGSLVSNQMVMDFEIKKTGETKTILGYTCHKYIGGAADYDFETYVAPDFPINMHDVYADVVSIYFDDTISDSYKDINGISLESVTTIDGEVYNTVATKVLESGLTISKADYDFNLE